jgi:copper chaperone
MNVVFTVPEISCGHCKDTIESTLKNVESIESASVDIEKKSVEVISSSDLDMMNVSQLLDEQGYTVVQSE